MSRSLLSALAALALMLAGGLAWWSLSRLRAPRVAGPTAAAPGQSGIAPTLATPGAIFPEPPPLAEESEPLPSEVGRSVAATESPWSAPLDVVVRDARTGLGVPFVRVRACVWPHSAWEQVDGAGLARFSQTFGAGTLELTLRDEFSNLRLETTTLRGPPVGEEPAPVEWPIDIGPAYGLQVDTRNLPPWGVPSIAAMLCETDSEGTLWKWSARKLSREYDGQRWMRYKEVEHEPAPGRNAILRVWAPGTFFGGEVPVPATIGLHDRITVELHASAGAFQGSVTDTEGNPVMARVIVMGGRPQDLGIEESYSGADSEWLELLSNKEGRFKAPAVAPGTYQVVVCSSRRPFERGEVTIATGEVTERSFILGLRVNEVDTQVEVTDAATGDPVEEARALVRLGSTWMSLVPSVGIAFGGSFDLDQEVIVGAHGYVPARVRAWDCVQVGNTREYRIRLRRGHGGALVVADADGRNFATSSRSTTRYSAIAFDEEFVGLIQTGSVPGARVFVDNLEISPDSSGLALIEASAPIEIITCEAPGWVMQGLKGFEPNGPGLGFALMARE